MAASIQACGWRQMAVHAWTDMFAAEDRWRRTDRQERETDGLLTGRMAAGIDGRVTGRMANKEARGMHAG
jgi:hypothetical protein